MKKNNLVILFVLTQLTFSCSGKKELEYYPEIIPPFLGDEIAVDEVFAEKEE